MKATKIKELKKGDLFKFDGIIYEYFGVYSPCVDYRAYKHNDKSVKKDFDGNEEVELVTGYELYLLQGGRDWD